MYPSVPNNAVVVTPKKNGPAPELDERFLLRNLLDDFFGLNFFKNRNIFFFFFVFLMEKKLFYKYTFILLFLFLHTKCKEIKSLSIFFLKIGFFFIFDLSRNFCLLKKKKELSEN